MSTITPTRRGGRPSAAGQTRTWSRIQTVRPSAVRMRYSSEWSSPRIVASRHALRVASRSSAWIWFQKKSGSASQRSVGKPSSVSAYALT